MSTENVSAGAGISAYWLQHRDRLFLASCIALIVTAMSFAIRGALIAPLGEKFGLDKTQLGWVIGTAFWGFTLAMIIGGPLCDVLGMRMLVAFAAVGHGIGIVMTIFAGGFWTLFFSTLAFGLANGFVEAACNPLIATLYPDEKIKRLNLFHVWFPGGIVIGGLASYAIDSFKIGGADHGWQIQMASMILPLIIYIILFIGQKFPATERVAAGVSTGEMFSECLRPFFLLFAVCMCMTAVTELGPGQWIPNILTVTTGAAGILFLVWQNGLMAIGRMFAGPLVHRVSPSGILLGSAIFSLIGLFMLSQARSAGSAWVAVTIFAIGVCFFWPTMLGNVSERFPKTGSLGLAIMGGIGMLSSNFAQPLIGTRYDTVAWETITPYATQVAARPDVPEGFKTALTSALASPPEAKGAAIQKAISEFSKQKLESEADKALQKEVGNEWTKAQASGGSAGLQQLVILPAILILIFGAVFVMDKTRGGYKKEVLIGDHS